MCPPYFTNNFNVILIIDIFFMNQNQFLKNAMINEYLEGG